MRQWINFYGRASRSEFWKINLFVLGAGFTLQIIMLSPLASSSAQLQAYLENFMTIFTALTTLPLLAIGSRRLHDIGKSGWWQLLMLTGIGVIPLTIWFLREGDDQPNSYGPPIN